MTRIVLTVLLLVLLCEGIGTWTLRLMKIDSRGFAAPIGFAMLLSALQLCYYPAQLANLSFTWIIVVSLIVLVLALIATLCVWKEVWLHLFSWNTVLAAVCAAVFLFAFSRCYVDLDFSDSATYLNYIAQNINIAHLNLFNPTNGLAGSEWDVLYLFQGYYHFGSFLCWLVNIPYYLLHSVSYISNLVVSVWGPGLLYNILSSMLIINMVRYFHIRNRWFELCILAFLLFYANFYYWKVAFAFYGNTYRGLFVTMLLYVIYRWFKEKNEQIKYLILFVTGAGLACSSSYLFMSFAVLYALAIYQFSIRKIRSLFDMLTFIIPLVLYACAFVSRKSALAAWLIFGAYTLLCFCRYQKQVRRFLARSEEFFFDYGVLIFAVIVPALFAVGSLLLQIFKPDPVVNYANYFSNFRGSDMVNDYLFLHSAWLDNLLNVFRWIGVAVILLSSKSAEDRFIRMLMIVMLTFFLNPLCTIALAKTITGIVYYRNFEVLFNPFTELLIFVFLYHFSEWQLVIQWLMEVSLLLAVAIGQVSSYLGSEIGLYSFYVKGGKNVDPVYKIDSDERAADEFLKTYIDENGTAESSHPQDRAADFADITNQPIVISQSNALRTYIPNAYQIFTPREYFYIYNRVDWNFYEIAKRHYSWLAPTDVHYQDTCMYLERYDVDYILLQYWENPEFDQATDACAVTVYTGSKFKVKAVNKEYEWVTSK